MNKLKAFRLNEDLIKKLKAVAKKNGKTETYIIGQALQCYFDEYQEYQIAKDRFDDHTDEIIGADEMWRRLGV